MSDHGRPSPRVLEGYLRELTHSVGACWNDFWFTPRDARTLSLLRIGCGLIALYMVLTYSFDLMRLFGERGLLPAHIVRHLFDPARISYFNHTSSTTEIAAFHALGLAVLVAFTAGWHTRITAVMALAIVLAYIHRGPVLTGQMEPVLAMLMFYLCLSPCGQWYSWDAWRRRRAASKPPVIDAVAPAERTTSAAVVTRLIQIHTAMIYFMMGLAKLTITDSSWWDGSAVWLVLTRPESSLLDLEWFRNVKLLNLWSHAIVAYELTFPVLIWNRLARPLVLLAGLVIWLPLSAVSPWAPFCLSMLLANLAFVPPRWLPGTAASQQAEDGNGSPRAEERSRHDVA